MSAEALGALTACLAEVYGNASSIHHFGQMAKQRLETARRQVASLIGCQPQEIVFTSGGTEADNLALLGTVRRAPGSAKHVVTTAIEHPAVLNTCAQLQREGVDVTYVRTGSDGVVDPDDIRGALRPQTVLVSVMHANNELGAVQPLAEIARVICDSGREAGCETGREAGIYLHSDGVQGLGKIPVDVNALGVDLYSMSGHKIYAPKGIGALYVRKGTKLSPIVFGGHHERDRRPGTENVPGAVAFGRAAAWIEKNLDDQAAALATLRDRLEAGILERVPFAAVNGSQKLRTPNTSNIYFDFLEGESLVIALDLRGFSVSTGSACSSGAIEPSHVLTAIGMPGDRARASIRFSLGRSNTAEQVDALIDAVADSVERLRKLSPVAMANV